MSEHEQETTRRRFLKSSTASAAAVTLGLNVAGAPLVGTARGANEKIRVGFIGIGNRGSQLLNGFLKQDDMEVAALCDAYEPYLMRDHSKVDKKLLDALGSRIPKMKEGLGGNVARYKDFRRLLDRKDIDAVVIATPDHWHAVQTIMACQAGKDVYVEKPLSVTVVEGRKMVEAAERYNRVVQVGLHRRSSKEYMRAVGDIQAGKIGKVTVGRAYRISNMHPSGIGRCPDTTPPEGLDWDMWLGPRAKRAY
ncbi:MAG: Gfo/Idh/MocA family oxidoreductase, partial [Phycisphaerales bacterium]